MQRLVKLKTSNSSLLYQPVPRRKTEQTIQEYADTASSSLKQLGLDENSYLKFAELIRKVTEWAY